MSKYRISKHDSKTYYRGQPPWSTYKTLKDGLQAYYRKPFFSFDSELGHAITAVRLDMDVYGEFGRLKEFMRLARHDLISRLKKDVISTIGE